MTSRGAVVVMSSGPDGVGAAFADHCRSRDVDVVFATRQSETRLYVEISQAPRACLQVLGADGARDIEPGSLRGIWVRDLPGSPPGLDYDDALYAGTEFGAAFIGFCRAAHVPCVGFPPLTSLLDDVATTYKVRDWCRQCGIAVLPPPGDRHLAPIPRHPDAAASSSGGPDAETAGGWPSRTGPAHCGTDDLIYYVVLGQRRQVLVAEGAAHRDVTLRRALEIGDRVSSMLSLDSGVIEFARHEPDDTPCRAAGNDADVALGEVLHAVPDGVILRDQAWYFDAVLDAFNV